MAEKVSVATLTIDEQGAVRSVNNLVGAEKQLDRQTASTASAFTARMFNMRTAAVAFLGGFTLGGAIYQLRGLAGEAVKANAAFGPMAESWERFNVSLTQTLGNLPGVTSGLEGVTTWLDRFTRVLGVARATEDKIGSGVSTGIIGRFLFGTTAIGQLVGALNTVGALIDKVLPPTEQAKAGIQDPWAISDWEKAVKDSQAAGDYLSGQPGSSSRFSPLPSIDPGAIDQWKEALDLRDRYLESLERQADALTTLRTLANEGFGGPGVETDFDLATAFSPDKIDFATEAWDAFASAIQYAAVSMANFIAEGGNAKDMFAGMLKSLAVAMYVKAGEYVAYAIASATGIGAISLQGTPGQFMAAAGKFFAVGTAAALGARAAGGGGGAGGGLAVGGYGGVSQAVPNSGAVPAQVTIILEGEHSDMSIRKITGGVLKAIGDGVGGSQFVTVPA